MKRRRRGRTQNNIVDEIMIKLKELRDQEKVERERQSQSTTVDGVDGNVMRLLRLKHFV